MKGIILAGGEGTRLYPLTLSVSKQLLPVYDKPLIYFPLCTLMSANIRDILCITSPNEINNFKKLLKNGKQWGINISYAIQKKPRGIADAFLVGEKFIGKNSVALILGDNIFYGINLENILISNKKNFKGVKIFTYKVKDPSRYGVVETLNDKVISIIEKPKKPKSQYVSTGLYFYDNDVINIAKNIKLSKRNELEITDVNNKYLSNNLLEAIKLETGTVWLDAGTTNSLLHAAQYVQIIQERQKIQIGSPEEISLYKKWITKKDIKNIISKSTENDYIDYLKNLIRK